MILITQKKSVFTDVVLTDEEALEVIKQYIRDVVIGHECYITTEGKLEHWTKYPHGSGTTTNKGLATPLQKAASDFLDLLRRTE